MDTRSQDNKSQQNFLALQYSLFIALISTSIIYVVDKFLFKHTDFRPLNEFQFYGVLFVVVLGLVLAFMFYNSKNGEVVEEVSEFKQKMAKKKLKKAKKAKARAR